MPGGDGTSEPLYRVLEQTAQGREQDTWHALMEQALSGLNCPVIQSTSEEAPGGLAYVEPHLGAHHSPDLGHVQPELVKAVCGPRATTPRAAAQAASEARERLAQRQGQLQEAADVPHKRGLGRPSSAPASLEQLAQATQAARQECEHIRAQREQGAQRLRRLGQSYHCVD